VPIGSTRTTRRGRAKRAGWGVPGTRAGGAAPPRETTSPRGRREGPSSGGGRGRRCGESARKGLLDVRFFAPIKISGSGWRLRETLSPFFFSEGVLRNDYCTLKNLAKRITSSFGSSAPPCCPWPSRSSHSYRRRPQPPPSRVARERPPRRRRREERKARSPRRRG
jgi:hypothetical protein